MGTGPCIQTLKIFFTEQFLKLGYNDSSMQLISYEKSIYVGIWFIW